MNTEKLQKENDTLKKENEALSKTLKIFLANNLELQKIAAAAIIHSINSKKPSNN
jgi:hypothetical protein